MSTTVVLLSAALLVALINWARNADKVRKFKAREAAAEALQARLESGEPPPPPPPPPKHYVLKLRPEASVVEMAHILSRNLNWDHSMATLYLELRAFTERACAGKGWSPNVVKDPVSGKNFEEQ